MFFALMQEYQDSAHEVFRETYDYELMLQSGESLKKLRQFIHFTLTYLREKAEPETGGRAQIDRVLEFIHQNIQRNIGRKEIAQAVYLNPEYLSRLFKKEMHIGLTEYLTQERMKIAQTLLRSTTLPIGLVASRVGYVNFSHFARIFKKESGCRRPNIANPPQRPVVKRWVVILEQRDVICRAEERKKKLV